MTDVEYDLLRAAKDEKRIDCSEALAIARKHGIPAKEVGAACDHLGIKIQNCQLGCFE